MPTKHSVSKLLVRRDNVFYTSSCVFIAPNIALTCAHSVCGYDEVSSGELRSINIFIHPEYDPMTSLYKNDLALIVFDKRVSYFSSIGACQFNDHFVRLGHGYRNDQNDLCLFDIKLKKINKTYIEFWDEKSEVGDSGGGVFNQKNELVSIHTTKEKGQIYTVYLQYYLSWMTPYINKYSLDALLDSKVLV